jgi:hypothetical protein
VSADAFYERGKFMCGNCDSKMTTAVKSIIPGKWYVVDRFSPKEKYGPYDTKAEAETARRAINIADDCVSLQAPKG